MKELSNAIKLEFKETEPCTQEILIEISSDAVDNEINRSALGIAKIANIQGFRKGKAPVSLIKKRFHEHILEEVEKNIANSVYKKISDDTQKKLMTMPVPTSDPKPVKEGQPYSLTMTVNVEPSFELPDYKKLPLEREKIIIDDSEVSASIDKLREHYAEYVTINEKAEEGDMLKVSYSSDLELSDDAPPSAKRCISAEKSWIWLNEPEIFPGIIKSLTGVVNNDKKELEIAFDEDFVEPLLAGKKANYKFEIHEVQRRCPLKEDKDLLEKLMVDDMETLRTNIKGQLELDKKNEATHKLHTEVINKLLEATPINELPPKVLETELQLQIQTILQEKKKKNEKEDMAAIKKEAETESIKFVKEFLICKRIAELENIKVEEHEIDSNISYLSKIHGYTPDKLKDILLRSGHLEKIYREILKNKVADFIINHLAPEAEDAKAEKSTDK